MRNEVTGVVSQALPIERGMGQRGPWAAAKVVIEYDAGRYKNTLMLECRNNKAEDFAKLQRGQKVTCYYDVTSREYNGRWYHSVNCFDFAVEGAQPQAPAPTAAAPAGGAQNDGDPF